MNIDVENPAPEAGDEELYRKEIIRLANLSDLEYERARDASATQFGVRVSELDKKVRAGKKALRDAASNALEAPEPWPEPVDGKALVNELQEVLCRYCILPDGGSEMIASWILFAHAHDAFTISPILAIQSPEKRCGKTTLLSVVSELVPKPLTCSNTSPAALFRMIDAKAPTMLLDEADTYLPGREDMRGLINGGYWRRVSSVIRTFGDDNEPRVFSTWAPKVIASIGVLEDTVQDRSIVITLRRKMRGEVVQGFREANAVELQPLMQKAARWADDNMKALVGKDPVLPDALNDRAKDNVAGLVVIADHICSEFGAKLRQAFVAAARRSEALSDPNASTQLLMDIREILKDTERPEMTSRELINALSTFEESPWPTWHSGRVISPKALAKMLRSFGISTHKTSNARLYRADDFADAFERYLGATS